MVNESNSAQRQATSSTNCNDAFSSASNLAEELEQNIDVLLLDQHVWCQSHHTSDQSLGKDSRGEKACPHGEVKLFFMIIYFIDYNSIIIARYMTFNNYKYFLYSNSFYRH